MGEGSGRTEARLGCVVGSGKAAARSSLVMAPVEVAVVVAPVLTAYGPPGSRARFGAGAVSPGRGQAASGRQTLTINAKEQKTKSQVRLLFHANPQVVTVSRPVGGELSKQFSDLPGKCQKP